MSFLLWRDSFVWKGVSWSMMPSIIRMLGKQFRPSSWRVLTVVCGTPSLMIACISGLLPQSPRHSLHRRRPRQALAILQQMYAINNSKHADTYPVRRPDALCRRFHYFVVHFQSPSTIAES